jgi:hypothetical protein
VHLRAVRASVGGSREGAADLLRCMQVAELGHPSGVFEKRAEAEGMTVAMEPKQYAFLFVRWRTAEWVATVFEGGRVRCHLHTDACAGGCDNTYDREMNAPNRAVADSISLAERQRSEVVAAMLEPLGPPEVVDTVIEPTGDPGPLEASMRVRPWWPALSSQAGSAGRARLLAATEPVENPPRWALWIAGFLGVVSAAAIWLFLHAVTHG